MQVKITCNIIGVGCWNNKEYDFVICHICDLTEVNGHIKELLDNGFKVTVEPYYGDDE